MGFIRIGQLATIELDDELLDHVFAVVIAKLRRHEPVLLRWNDCEDHTEQVFVNPSCALIAEFGTVQRPGGSRGGPSPTCTGTGIRRRT